MAQVVTVGFAIIMGLVISTIGKRRGWSNGRMLAIGVVTVVPIDAILGYNWTNMFPG